MGLSIFHLSCSVVGIRSEENPKYEVIVSGTEKYMRG